MSCEKPAVALLTFSARDAKAWLYDLHEPDATGGLMLCRKHANATVVPMSWQLVDGRDPAWSGPEPETPAPGVQAFPTVATPSTVPVVPGAPAAAAPAVQRVPTTPSQAPVEAGFGAEPAQVRAVVPVAPPVPAPLAHAPVLPPVVPPPVTPYPSADQGGSPNHDATLFQLSLNDLPSPRGY